MMFICKVFTRITGKWLADTYNHCFTEYMWAAMGYEMFLTLLVRNAEELCAVMYEVCQGVVQVTINAS